MTNNKKDYEITELKTKELNTFTWALTKPWNIKGTSKVRQFELDYDNNKITIVYTLDREQNYIAVYNHTSDGKNNPYRNKIKTKEVETSEKLLEELKLSEGLENLIKKVI